MITQIMAYVVFSFFSLLIGFMWSDYKDIDWILVLNMDVSFLIGIFTADYLSSRS